MKSDVNEIADVIGKNGIYQILSLAMGLYISALSGSAGVFIEFMSPDLEIYWNYNSTGENRTSFHSRTCRIDDIYSAKPSLDLNEPIELVYKSEYSHRTLTEDLGLICERSWLVSFSKCLLLLGAGVGSLAFGGVSERYGRRKVGGIMIIMCAAANVCLLFPRNYVIFALGCIVFGGTSFPVNTNNLVIIMELVPMSKRSSYGTFTKYGMVLGQTYIAAAAWLTQDWFYLQVAQLIFVSLIIPFYWYTLESPVWLTVRGRDEEAKEILKKIARRNGSQVDSVDEKIDTWVQNLKVRSLTQKNDENKLINLVNTKTMRKYIFSLSFIQLSLTITYYGLTVNLETFGSSLYEDFMISSALAVLSMILCTVCLLYVSIRIFSTLFNVVLIAACVAYAFMYDNPLARSIFSILIRVLCTPLVNCIFVYSSEILPSSVRVLGIAVSSSAGRFFSAFSSFSKEIVLGSALYVPIIIYGILITISTCLLFFALPETKGKPLAQTVLELKEKSKEKPQPSVFSIFK